jgi:hypothetical protein
MPTSIRKNPEQTKKQVVDSKIMLAAKEGSGYQDPT